MTPFRHLPELLCQQKPGGTSGQTMLSVLSFQERQDLSLVLARVSEKSQSRIRSGSRLSSSDHWGRGGCQGCSHVYLVAERNLILGTKNFLQCQGPDSSYAPPSTFYGLNSMDKLVFTSPGKLESSNPQCRNWKTNEQTNKNHFPRHERNEIPHLNQIKKKQMNWLLYVL